MQTFKISEDFIKNRKKILLYMGLSMPIMMVFFFMLFTQADQSTINWSVAAPFLIGATLFIVVELFIVSYVMFKKIREMSWHFEETSLSRCGGKKTETFTYETLSDLVVHRNKANEIMMIKLKGNKKPLVLAGLGHMEDLVQAFEQRGMVIETRVKKIDWNSPKAFLATMVVTILVLTVLILLFRGFYEYFNILFQMSFGGYFLVGKPISKSSGARFVWFERILGSLLVVLGMIQLALRFMH